ncbi:MAG TPA: DUF4870 domain-containing protein [Candidatus Aquilonibacter sp.]|nr:DUF4870 domain-containing protein [Candidatus Aquilonibacter sp.]
MAHCTKCGAAVADNASFCGSCGASQGAASSTAPAGPAPIVAADQAQMSENVAGLLCYLVGWVTGLIFYFVDKRPYVRFHAAQSIVLFGGLHLINIVVGLFFGMSFMMGGFSGMSAGVLFYWLIGLVSFVLWIVLMIKAYQGERFRVPVAADIAEKIFGKA